MKPINLIKSPLTITKNTIISGGNVLTQTNPIISTLRERAAANKDTQKNRFPHGAHLRVSRSTYSHHGIMGYNKEVIHYMRDKGICRVSLEKFKQGSRIQIVNSSLSGNNYDVIRRAESRIGESDYHLLFNNCEHFARWCRSGM